MLADVMQRMRWRNGIGVDKPEHVSGSFERARVHLQAASSRRGEDICA